MNATKAKFKKSHQKRATARGERIHSDVKEVPASSHGGHRYAVCFVDDAGRYIYATALRLTETAGA